jgi:hypothetical protein
MFRTIRVVLAAYFLAFGFSKTLLGSDLSPIHEQISKQVRLVTTLYSKHHASETTEEKNKLFQQIDTETKKLALLKNLLSSGMTGGDLQQTESGQWISPSLESKIRSDQNTRAFINPDWNYSFEYTDFDPSKNEFNGHRIKIIRLRKGGRVIAVAQVVLTDGSFDDEKCPDINWYIMLFHVDSDLPDSPAVATRLLETMYQWAERTHQENRFALPDGGVLDLSHDEHLIPLIDEVLGDKMSWGPGEVYIKSRVRGALTCERTMSAEALLRSTPDLKEKVAVGKRAQRQLRK